MGRRREQRQEERATFGRRGTATRYRMRQKLVAFGDDFWIEDESGRRAFKVDGKMLRVRDILCNGRAPVWWSCWGERSCAMAIPRRLLRPFART